MSQPTPLQRTEMYIKISRIHRRRGVVAETDVPHIRENNASTNATWSDFWKRPKPPADARIYPEQVQEQLASIQRQRANAHVSDTDDSEPEK